MIQFQELLLNYLNNSSYCIKYSGAKVYFSAQDFMSYLSACRYVRKPTTTGYVTIDTLSDYFVLEQRYAGYSAGLTKDGKPRKRFISSLGNESFIHGMIKFYGGVKTARHTSIKGTHLIEIDKLYLSDGFIHSSVDTFEGVKSVLLSLIDVILGLDGCYSEGEVVSGGSSLANSDIISAVQADQVRIDLAYTSKDIQAAYQYLPPESICFCEPVCLVS